jgi:predicted Zn-dependent protease
MYRTPIGKLLATASLAGYALLASSAALAISDQELEVQSAEQFAKMKASMPLVTDRATIDYIACVANAVVKVLEKPYSDENWEMAIFDVDAVNAFAMPGGKIGVMRGILKAAKNQDELAAVLGHEIAHVTSEHAKKRASRGSVSNVGIEVAAVLLGGGNGGATYTAYEALNQGAALGIMLPYSRNQESEADVKGLEYMARAGFDPRAAVPLWQNMDKVAGGQPAEFLSTHPSNEKRIDALISEWPKVLPLYNDAVKAGHVPHCVPPETPADAATPAENTPPAANPKKE